MQTSQNLAQADPLLGRLMQEIELPGYTSTQDVFHDLMSCLIEQQIHYRSTKKIFARAMERAGLERLSLDNFHLLEQHALPHLSLSAAKYESMLQLLALWQAGPPDFSQLPDETIITQLSAIPGIGRWTIDMILLFTLERPNVFPADDYHLKQIMTHLYQLNPKSRLKQQMLDIAAHWGEQRSLAVRYLLAHKSKSRPPK